MKLVTLRKGIHAGDTVKRAEGFADKLATYKEVYPDVIVYTVYTRNKNKALAKRLADRYRLWDKEVMVKVIADSGLEDVVHSTPLKYEIMKGA